MTTPLVQSISDEQLADSERLIADLEQFVCIGSIAALIARLRAAEADAKRYRKWTGLMFVEPSKLARALASCESIDDVDAALDAMERTP
jgi:hypothetical protein